MLERFAQLLEEAGAPASVVDEVRNAETIYDAHRIAYRAGMPEEQLDAVVNQLAAEQDMDYLPETLRNRLEGYGEEMVEEAERAEGTGGDLNIWQELAAIWNSEVFEDLLRGRPERLMNVDKYVEWAVEESLAEVRAAEIGDKRTQADRGWTGELWDPTSGESFAGSGGAQLYNQAVADASGTFEEGERPSEPADYIKVLAQMLEEVGADPRTVRQVRDSDNSEDGMEAADNAARSAGFVDVVSNWHAGMQTEAATRQFDEVMNRVQDGEWRVEPNGNVFDIATGEQLPVNAHTLVGQITGMSGPPGLEEEGIEEEIPYVPPILGERMFGLYEDFYEGLPPLDEPIGAQTRYAEAAGSLRMVGHLDPVVTQELGMISGYQHPDLHRTLVRDAPYREGDQTKVLLGMSTESKAALQHELVAAGFLAEDEYIPGWADPNTAAALATVMSWGNAQGLSFGNLIARAKAIGGIPQAYRGGGRAARAPYPGFAPKPYQPLDWASIAQRAKETAESQLNPRRELKDWEIEMLAAELRKFHKQDYRNAVEAARLEHKARAAAYYSGADQPTSKGPPDIQYIDRFREYFEDRYANEIDRDRRVEQWRDNFRSLLTSFATGKGMIRQ